MSQPDDLFHGIATAADRETADRLECLLRGLPGKYTLSERVRLRVLTNAIYARGAGLEESLEMARKQVRAQPLQSVVADLRSRFWESPYPSEANAKVLAAIRALRSE